jgi:C-terminal processing protease CtpA/Prc
MPDYRGYGFTLNTKSKPKYMIFQIDQSSPAYMANLNESDVIVEINKQNIRKLKFPKVKQMLMDSQKNNSVEILAISKEGYMYYKNRNKRFSDRKLVTKDNVDEHSTYTGRTPSQGPTAHLSINDRAVSSDRLGGGSSISIRDDSVKITGEQQQQRPASTTSSTRVGTTTSFGEPFRATGSSSEVNINAPITSSTTDEGVVHVCTIVKRPEYRGIGLTLQNAGSQSKSRNKQQRDPSASATPFLITSIEPGSPAEESGLLKGDQIVEIDGKSTHGVRYEQVIGWIRQSGNQIEVMVKREDKSGTTQNAITTSTNVVSSPSVTTVDGRYQSPEELQRENARKLAETVILSSREIIAQETTPNTQRKSRLDAQYAETEVVPTSSSPKPQQGGSSPQIIHSEIRMNSSKLQQQQQPISNTSSPQTSNKRNQSEPPPPKYPTDTVATTSGSTLNNTRPLVETQYPSTSQSHLATTQLPTSSSPISRRSNSSFNIPRDAPIPRLCRVRPYEEQLGFIVAGSKSHKGVFKVNDVQRNSPAEHSGLQNDDYIIEISGVNVESMTYDEVIDLIRAKKNEDDLQLLVADRGTINWYRSRKIPISSNLVPKMKYIETLLKEELQLDSNDEVSLRSNNNDNATNGR